MNEKENCVGCLYAIEYQDGIVKMGTTQNIKRRVRELKDDRPNGYQRIINLYVSGPIPDARKAEKRSMRGLCPVYKSEYFKIPFEKAVMRIQKEAGEESAYNLHGYDNIVKHFEIRPSSEEGQKEILLEMLRLIEQYAESKKG